MAPRAATGASYSFPAPPEEALAWHPEPTAAGPISVPAAAPRTLALLPWGGPPTPASASCLGLPSGFSQVVPRVARRAHRLVDTLAVSSPRPGFQKHQGRSAPARVSISACASISQLLEHRASSSLQAMTEPYDVMIGGRWVQRELESMSPPEASLLGTGPCLGAGNAGQPRPAGPTDPPTFSDRCRLNSLLCLSKWASGKILLRKKE